jgi:hypothetical protein
VAKAIQNGTKRHPLFVHTIHIPIEEQQPVKTQKTFFASSAFLNFHVCSYYGSFKHRCVVMLAKRTADSKRIVVGGKNVRIFCEYTTSQKQTFSWFRMGRIRPT